MKAIAAYMATKHGEDTRGREYRQNEYREPVNREYENSVYNERQPNQRPVRNRRDEYKPEGNEMRSRMDSRDRYMMDDERGKPGTNRSEYEGGEVESDPIGRRMDDDEDERQMNVIQWPYGSGSMPPESRTIGFGNRSHYDGGRQEADVGGTMWMQPTEKTRSGMMMFDRETAEEWVHNMRNEDKNHPHGGKWTHEALKPFAQKYNIQLDSPKFWEFYAMTNAMYSDYSEVAKKFGITSPEFYACMAKAFMDDRDAEPDKVARYYEYIAKK